MGFCFYYWSFDAFAIYSYKKDKLPLWLSGIVIAVIGPILASIVGSLLVKLNVSQGSTAEGSQIAGAFIAIITIINGIIYFIVGVIQKVTERIKGGM